MDASEDALDDTTVPCVLVACKCDQLPDSDEGEQGPIHERHKIYRTSPSSPRSQQMCIALVLRSIISNRAGEFSRLGQPSAMLVPLPWILSFLKLYFQPISSLPAPFYFRLSSHGWTPANWSTGFALTLFFFFSVLFSSFLFPLLSLLCWADQVGRGTGIRYCTLVPSASPLETTE